MLRISPGTSGNRGVVGRRSLTGGTGRYVTRNQKYREIRSGLGLSAG
jgi:hypothetical protein